MRCTGARVFGQSKPLIASTVAAITVLRAIVFFSVDADAAEPTQPQPSSQQFWREAWIGADATPSSWLVFSGVTLSPLSGIHDDGPRLRFATGYGGYRDKGRFEHLYDPKNGDPKVNVVAPYQRSGATNYFDASIGYLWRLDPLTAKAFVGFSSITHRRDDWIDIQHVPHEVLGELRDYCGDLRNCLNFGGASDGEEFALKLALELWLNIGHRGWASLDLNWTGAYETYSARFRTAWRAWPTVSLGIEGILNGDLHHTLGKLSEEFDASDIERRGGAFARYEWYGGEVSLAGGMASAPGGDGVRPYATLNWITQF